MRIYRRDEPGCVVYTDECGGDVRLKDGMRLTVTWPDGSRETLPLVSRDCNPIEVELNCGLVDTRFSREFGFLVSYRGIGVWVSVEQLTDVTFEGNR